MSNKNDVSGFNPQERHQIIVDYLKQINKPTKVFHLRWKPGELLTGKVLETTPMFWYMKYRWGRQDIETMFYKARCVIGPLFDSALQQTYGGQPGPRWRGAIPEKEKSVWRQRQADKLAAWQLEQAEKLRQQKEHEKQRKADEQRRKAEEERLRKEAEKKLAFKSKDIWNAVSDFGADKAVNYQTFSDNLKDRGINVSPLLAKQLFDQLAGPGGKLSRQQMDELIRKLDKMNDSATITWDMLGDKLGCMTIMKRVLLAAGIGTAFNVDDFVFAQKFGVSIQPIQFMNKLSDRDVPWDDRVRAMEQLGANLATNPLFNNVLAPGNIPELLCGWATQVLDSKAEVQKTAIDTLPGVFHNAMEFGDKDIAIGYLEEVLDNLFKVLDDPNARKNHKPAKEAIAKIIEDIVNNGDPESILVVSHILAEKCDIANATNPQSRETALVNLQKIMLGPNNPIARQLQDKTKKDPPTNILHNLPPKGSVNREWLDIATNKIPGPSENYMDSERSPMKGKSHRDNRLQQDPERKYDSGAGPDENSLQELPYVAVSSTPSDAKPRQPVKFDASTSVDCDGDPCKTFKWDFGDGSPPQTTTKPVVNHMYNKPGTFPVKCTATDKHGRKGSAGLSQKVSDPRNPKKKMPPYAAVKSTPPEASIGQPVVFDASESNDFEGDPCKAFVWDFGDGTPKVTTKGPVTKHPYQKQGVYPVSVQVVDKNNLKSNASLNQRVRKPEPEDPYVAVSSTPSESKPKQPVKFDASKSVDMDGEPCKNFIFDFGDGSPPIEQPAPIANHAYDAPGTYPVHVTATDKNGRKGNASVNQRVIDPQNPKTTLAPTAAVTSTPPDAKPRQPVTFDASKSHDMDHKPCVKFIWDFGDGTPKVTTHAPVTKHAYNQPDVYPVNVRVVDKYGQTADAALQQRVSDPSMYDDDPNRGPKAPKNKNYGGRKGKGNKKPSDPAGKFGVSGNNKKPFSPQNIGPESKEPDRPSDEIGDEFRNVVHDAVSKAILDPNPNNKKAATKTAAVMSKLDPSFMKSLDPEAKKQYEWGLKPFKPKKHKELPPKPDYKSGSKALHPVQFEVNFDAGKPILPDI